MFDLCVALNAQIIHLFTHILLTNLTNQICYADLKEFEKVK